MMLIIWTLFLLHSISCYGVTETQEETDNVTTLFPIAKNSSHHGNHTSDSVKTGSFLQTISLSNEDSNKTESKGEPVIEKPGNDSKEFKPSVHFQDFFDEDDFGIVPLPTKPSVDVGGFAPLKKPPSAFIGSQKDSFKLHKPKPPLERFPYKFEDAILTRAKSKWRPPASGLQSRPTVPVPATVPAGGLYKKPDPFKDKPSDDDEDFGLTFQEEKENFVKKRANPWQGLLHLLTAFIPVGLIISALTPSVITIQNTGPGGPGGGPVGPGFGPTPGLRPAGAGGIEPLPPRLFRRSDEVLDPPPPPPATSHLPPTISEPCRRRLLCELHSEKNYIQHGGVRRGRACHRLPCDDPGVLAETLRWLLHRKPDYNRFTQLQ